MLCGVCLPAVQTGFMQPKVKCINLIWSISQLVIAMSKSHAASLNIYCNINRKNKQIKDKVDLFDKKHALNVT